MGPPDFAGTVRGLTPTFYVPFMMAEELNGFPLFDVRGHTSLFVKARLRPGVALPQSETAVGAVAPPEARTPGAASPVSSGGATRWSSRN